MSEESSDKQQYDPIPRKSGIQKRMQCSGRTASQIANTFVSVRRLVNAIKSDKPLTEKDGIGPKTAEVINNWWEHRFKREEDMNSGTIEDTGPNTAIIHIHRSWSPIIGDKTNHDE